MLDSWIPNLTNHSIAVQLEQKNLEQQNEDLVQAFREKSRSQQQAQRLYQNLKTQVLASQVQLAASDDAEQTLHYATGNKPHGRFEPSGTSSFGRNSGRYSSDRIRFEPKGHPQPEHVSGSRSYNNAWDAHLRAQEPISTLSIKNFKYRRLEVKIVSLLTYLKKDYRLAILSLVIARVYQFRKLGCMVKLTSAITWPDGR